MVGLKEQQRYNMGLVEAIKKLKAISNKLTNNNLTNDQILQLNKEMHKIIELIEVPELIGEFNNEYVS